MYRQDLFPLLPRFGRNARPLDEFVSVLAVAEYTLKHLNLRVGPLSLEEQHQPGAEVFIEHRAGRISGQTGEHQSANELIQGIHDARAGFSGVAWPKLEQVELRL